MGEGGGGEDILYHGERLCSHTRNSRLTRPLIMSWNLDHLCVIRMAMETKQKIGSERLSLDVFN